MRSLKSFIVSAVLGAIILNGLGLLVDVLYGTTSLVRQFIFRVLFTLIGIIFVTILTRILVGGGGEIE